MNVDIDLIESEGLKFRGSGVLTPAGARSPLECAFEFALAPFGESASLECWSESLSQWTGPAVGDVTFEGEGTDGARILGHGFADVIGRQRPGAGSLASCRVTLRDFELPPSANVFVDNLGLESSRDVWEVPLYSLDFGTEHTKTTYVRTDEAFPEGAENHEGEDAFMISSFGPWFSEVHWRDWDMQFAPRNLKRPVGRTLRVSGTLTVVTPRGVPPEEVRERLDTLADLLAPLSGIVGPPRTLWNTTWYRAYWTHGQRPQRQWRVNLPMVDEQYLRVKPYLEKVLPFFDSHSEKQRAALRALARSLTVPFVPYEQSILATATGIEILREHFWPRDKTEYLSPSTQSSVAEALRRFAPQVPQKWRQEYLDGCAAKAQGVSSRPFRRVADEVVVGFNCNWCGGGRLKEFVRLRNDLVHKGMIKQSPDPFQHVLEANRVLVEAFTGLLGLGSNGCRAYDEEL